MTQDVPLTIAFLAGIFSFLSPCVLPIVPGFMSYILGKSFSDIQNTSLIKSIEAPIIIKTKENPEINKRISGNNLNLFNFEVF